MEAGHVGSYSAASMSGRPSCALRRRLDLDDLRLRPSRLGLAPTALACLLRRARDRRLRGTSLLRHRKRSTSCHGVAPPSAPCDPLVASPRLRRRVLLPPPRLPLCCDRRLGHKQLRGGHARAERSPGFLELRPRRRRGAGGERAVDRLDRDATDGSRLAEYLVLHIEHQVRTRTIEHAIGHADGGRPAARCPVRTSVVPVRARLRFTRSAIAQTACASFHCGPAAAPATRHTSCDLPRRHAPARHHANTIGRKRS